MIDGQRFLLDADRDIVDIMEQIETAARSEPTFVHLVEDGERVSVLVSPGSTVSVTVADGREVEPEDRAPFTTLPEWDL